MGDLGGDIGFFGDADDFFDGFEDARGFVAHVGSVDSAVSGCGFCEVYEFLGVGEGARDVDETGAEAECA